VGAGKIGGRGHRNEVAKTAKTKRNHLELKQKGAKGKKKKKNGNIDGAHKTYALNQRRNRKKGEKGLVVRGRIKKRKEMWGKEKNPKQKEEEGIGKHWGKTKQENKLRHRPPNGKGRVHCPTKNGLPREKRATSVPCGKKTLDKKGGRAPSGWS